MGRVTQPIRVSQKLGGNIISPKTLNQTLRCYRFVILQEGLPLKIEGLMGKWGGRKVRKPAAHALAREQQLFCRRNAPARLFSGVLLMSRMRRDC